MRLHSFKAAILGALSLLFTAGLVLSVPTGAAAQELEELKQVQLTDAHVKGFLEAQKDLQPLSSKLLEGGEKPDDTLIAELEAIAKKHGFASFEEMEVVGANISLVLDGLDPATGAYTDPVEKMKLELENIKADTSIVEDDKKLVIDDLNQEIAAAKPLQFKDNIEVVKKYQNELETLAVDGAGESQPEGAAPPAKPADATPAPADATPAPAEGKPVEEQK